MAPADKAALRLTVGLGVAVLVAYGFALPMPFVLCVMAVILLSKPGPPMPLARGTATALVLAVLLTAGVLMVPVLENYALTGVLLTAAVLYAVFYKGLRAANPVTMVLVMAFALIPVAGVADQALVGMLSLTVAAGVVVGGAVKSLSYALFPDEPASGTNSPTARSLSHETAAWIALRATMIVMPVFVLALTNPSLYLAAIMKTVTLGQQAGETTARSAGKELVGSTLMGALVGACVWLGLSVLANLWMLMLWLMAAALWCGTAMFGARRSAFRPSFWSNALITALILLGPAIEDSANGKSVLQASVVRTSLFVAVALYAWVTVWVLERWRESQSRSSARPLESSEDTA
jgi:hypothetical protein